MDCRVGKEGLRSTPQGPEQVGAKVEEGQKEGQGQYEGREGWSMEP